MARPKLADEIQNVKNLATDPAKTPRARILAARRLVREFGFSTRNLRVANKIAKLFLSDMGISIDDRKSAQSLFEYIHDHQPTHEDQDENDVTEDTEPTSGTVEPVTPKGPPHISPGFKNFEELLPHVRGLDQLNLDDPSALEYGNSVFDKRQALCISIGLQVQECRRRMFSSDDRGCPPNAEIIQAIVSWANEHLESPLDPAKPQAVLIGRWGLRLTQNSPRFNSLYQDLFCEDDKRYFGEQVCDVVPSIRGAEIPVPEPIGPVKFRPDLSVPPGAVVPNTNF